MRRDFFSGTLFNIITHWYIMSYMITDGHTVSYIIPSWHIIHTRSLTDASFRTISVHTFELTEIKAFSKNTLMFEMLQPRNYHTPQWMGGPYGQLDPAFRFPWQRLGYSACALFTCTHYDIAGRASSSPRRLRSRWRVFLMESSTRVLRGTVLYWVGAHCPYSSIWLS